MNAITVAMLAAIALAIGSVIWAFTGLWFPKRRLEESIRKELGTCKRRPF